MDEVLRHHRQVVVHHVRDAVHVDPARRDIRGDEHAGRSRVEGLQGSVALDLGATPVQRDRMHTGVDELA